ncbi:hypothetical protein EVAR_875_1 [Eumeta japonica]|uniref:Uncharacterized protein n=1 Tax=Eumeta variegata TaxID=151549 RepID=A0A4C1SEH0_EUMVA|nr:hypothetical protein EVAR_875_1 [Eumeta japonica]
MNRSVNLSEIGPATVRRGRRLGDLSGRSTFERRARGLLQRQRRAPGAQHAAAVAAVGIALANQVTNIFKYNIHFGSRNRYQPPQYSIITNRLYNVGRMPSSLLQCITGPRSRCNPETNKANHSRPTASNVEVLSIDSRCRNGRTPRERSIATHGNYISIGDILRIFVMNTAASGSGSPAAVSDVAAGRLM